MRNMSFALTTAQVRAKQKTVTRRIGWTFLKPGAVFGFPSDSSPTLDQVDKAFKAAAKQRHPDVGGTEIEMSHLNRARDYALMELDR